MIVSSGIRELDVRRANARSSPSIARTLAKLDLNAAVIRIDQHTKELERLTEMHTLRRITAGGIDQRVLEMLSGATSVEELSLNGSAIESFAPLRRMAALVWVSVHVATRLRSLSGIEAHRNLKFLEITECATVTDLEPLRSLEQLQLLTLDGRKYKPMGLDSLEPLTGLQSLRVLRLSAVRVRDRDLSPLFGLSALQRLDLPGYFPSEQFEALAEHLPDVRGTWRDAWRRSRRR